jgi:hypothetical protein
MLTKHAYQGGEVARQENPGGELQLEERHGFYAVGINPADRDYFTVNVRG